jgi:hypothetical protein
MYNTLYSDAMTPQHPRRNWISRRKVKSAEQALCSNIKVSGIIQRRELKTKLRTWSVPQTCRLVKNQELTALSYGIERAKLQMPQIAEEQ